MLEEEALVAKASALAEILKMFEDSKPLQLDLLHMICKRFPSNNQVKGITGSQFVNVRCSCNRTHSVAPLGFLLLEKVEATLESEEQYLENVQIDRLDESMLVALSCRAKRQQNLVNSVKTFSISCHNKRTIDALSTLMEHCQEICFRILRVEEEVGQEGSAVLRQAFQLPARRDPDWPYSLRATRKAMAEGRRGDLRAIWETLQDVSFWTMVFQTERYDNFLYVNGEEDWARLEKYLDLDKEELDKLKKKVKQEKTFVLGLI